MRKAIAAVVVAILLVTGIASILSMLWDRHHLREVSVLAPAPTSVPTAVTTHHPKPVRVVIDESAADLLPQRQEWDDRCALLVLRESYGSNAEETAKCGGYRLRTPGK